MPLFPSQASNSPVGSTEERGPNLALFRLKSSYNCEGNANNQRAFSAFSIPSTGTVIVPRKLFRVRNTELGSRLRSHNLEISNFVICLSKPAGKQKDF